MQIKIQMKRVSHLVAYIHFLLLNIAFTYVLHCTAILIYMHTDALQTTHPTALNIMLLDVHINCIMIFTITVRAGIIGFTDHMIWGSFSDTSSEFSLLICSSNLIFFLQVNHHPQTQPKFFLRFSNIF